MISNLEIIVVIWVIIGCVARVVKIANYATHYNN